MVLHCGAANFRHDGYGKIVVKKPSIEATELKRRGRCCESTDARNMKEDNSLKKLLVRGYAYWAGLFFDILLALFPVYFISTFLYEFLVGL